MGLEEAGGQAGLVGWLVGWKRGAVAGWVILPYRFTWKRWPSVFAHATGRNVFRATAEATEGVEKGKKAGEGREQKKKNKTQKNEESVGHMSPFARPPAWSVAGCHAEPRSRGLDVEPVQTHGGVTA